MKIRRLVLISWIFIFSCEPDEAPNYSEIPFVKGATLEFIEGSSVDSLVLEFTFRDGDYNLGLSSSDPADRMFPYNRFNFFTKSEEGILNKVVSSYLQTNSGEKLQVLPDNNHPGKLVNYHRLPESPSHYTCSDLYFGELYLSKDNEFFIDADDHIVDFIGTPPNEYYVLRDTFLIELNPDYYNVNVETLVEQPDGAFEVFDLAKAIFGQQPHNCVANFNGRFPFIEGQTSTVKAGPFTIRRISKYAGKFRYAMYSAGFKQYFGGKKIKMQVSIKDRALNLSNVIETPVILVPQ